MMRGFIMEESLSAAAKGHDANNASNETVTAVIVDMLLIIIVIVVIVVIVVVVVGGGGGGGGLSGAPIYCLQQFGGMYSFLGQRRGKQQAHYIVWTWLSWRLESSVFFWKSLHKCLDVIHIRKNMFPVVHNFLFLIPHSAGVLLDSSKER